MSIEKDPIKVLFLTEGRNVPASRFRVHQFEPILKREGIEHVIRYPVPSKYLWLPASIANAGPVGRLPFLAPQAVLIAGERLAHILRWGRWADVIVLQRELLHRFPWPTMERLVAVWRRRGARLLFDVDDAIYLDKQGRQDERKVRKLESICRACDLVLAGNEHLARFFGEFTCCTVIPTVIDTGRYRRGARRVSPILTIGWTGSATNLHYLRAIEGALNDTFLRHPFRFLVITNAGAETPFSAPRFEVEMKSWTEQREIEDLEEIDIGLMPLPDDEWARGKCGFKLLQYMALGIPCVASPVGVNPSIVIQGENGFLASSSDEWSDALGELAQSTERRNNLGDRARAHIEQSFSLARWSRPWLRAILGSD